MLAADGVTTTLGAALATVTIGEMPVEVPYVEALDESGV
jgi:hypothetical protein